MAGERVLVVDDDILIVKALTAILQREGYRVIAHTDPEAAAKEVGVQVVVSDFTMPKLNGIQLLEALRKTNPSAVRILLTAAPDAGPAFEAVDNGDVHKLLTKPWVLAELIACVRQAAIQSSQGPSDPIR